MPHIKKFAVVRRFFSTSVCFLWNTRWEPLIAFVILKEVPKKGSFNPWPFLTCWCSPHPPPAIPNTWAVQDVQSILSGDLKSWNQKSKSSLLRQNAENLKQIFPEKEYWGLSPNFHFHVSVSELYISTMGLPFLLEEISGPILGIYKSLTDTWMWKLGLRPRNSHNRNI